MPSRPELKLDWCSHQAAKYACETWHYSRTIPKSKLAKIGVWEDSQFIGAIIFGVGATRELVTRYGLTPEQGCELVRVALKEHKNPVSRIVSISLRILRTEYPGLRLAVSFADPEHGHIGGIYQAGGWLYFGRTQPANEYIYQGKRWQGRSWRHANCATPGPAVKIVKGSAKYRYLMPLDPDMRAKILPFAKHYPKRAVGVAGDTPANHAGEGGSTPTTALSIQRAEAEGLTCEKVD